MKLLWVAQKSLLEFRREFQLLALVLLLPLVFLGIYAVSYNASPLITYRLAVINQTPAGEGLIEYLQAQQYDTGKPVFDLNLTADRPAAEIALKDQKTAALLVISASANGKLITTVKGDALFNQFYSASSRLDAAIVRYADGIAGKPEAVRLQTQAMATGTPQSEFDLYAPGVIVFALLLLIPQTALLVAREIRWDTLRRLRLAPMSAWDLLGGIGLAQMVVAAAQVVIIFVGAGLMGFHNQGSLAVAMVIGLVIAFSAIGLGLIVACFVEDDSQATNLGSSLSMVQVFLSGAFFQLPALTVFTLAGHPIGVFDIFPATHGFLALQQVLSYGANFSEISFRLGLALLLSLAYLAAGVFIFHRLKMRQQA